MEKNSLVSDHYTPQPLSQIHEHSCCVTARSLSAGATMINQQDPYPL